MATTTQHLEIVLLRNSFAVRDIGSCPEVVETCLYSHNLCKFHFNIIFTTTPKFQVVPCFHVFRLKIFVCFSSPTMRAACRTYVMFLVFCGSSQWPRGKCVCCPSPLGRWNRWFEDYSGYECVFLCALSCVRGRGEGGVVPPYKESTKCL
jgi:hypothetical protein